jgi:hypothetical protein
MREKIDRLTAAWTNIEPNTLVKEVIHSHLRKMSKLFERYKNMKKEGLNDRASDPTYHLLDADSIEQQNASLSQRYQGFAMSR